MTKPPSPTTLRPASGRPSGLNRKVIVIGGIVVFVIGGFAISQMYFIDDGRYAQKDTGMHITLDNDEFLKGAPEDYLWMRTNEPPQPEAPGVSTQGNTQPAFFAAPPPPPPDPPFEACRRPGLSYEAGGLETAYDGVLEYQECRKLTAYKRELLAYVKKYPNQGGGQPPLIGGKGSGQMVTAGSTAQYQPASTSGMRMSARSSSEKTLTSASRQGGADRSSATAQGTDTADASVTQASGLYHDGSLEELPVEECVIPAGDDIAVVLDKDVNVSQAGTARLSVSRDVYDFTRSQIAIPAGSKIVVKYSGDLQYGQERAQIESTILTLPNGLTMELGGMHGYDSTGQTGLPVDVNNHNWSLFGTAVLAGVIDAIPAMAGLRTNVDFGGGVNGVTSAGRQIVDRELNRAPSAEPIPAGTEALVSLPTHLVLGECYQ